MRHEAGGGVVGLAEVVANQVAGKLAQGASSWFPRLPTKAAVLDQVEHEAGLPRTRATREENSPGEETVFEDIFTRPLLLLPGGRVKKSPTP